MTKKKIKRGKYRKDYVPNPALRSWDSLNYVLMASNETECLVLFKEETQGKKRRTFLRRIHSRINKIRADRERVELYKI